MFKKILIEETGGYLRSIVNNGDFTIFNTSLDSNGNEKVFDMVDEAEMYEELLGRLDEMEISYREIEVVK